MFHTLVMKFGGTSVGDARAIRQVVSIVGDAWKKDANRLIIVTSAMSKVTDLLEEGLRRAALEGTAQLNETVEAIEDRHVIVAQDLLGERRQPVLGEIKGLIEGYRDACQRASHQGSVTPHDLDLAMGFGEQLTVCLLSAALSHAGLPSAAVDASRLIITDDRFQNANPLLEPTSFAVQQDLMPLLDQGQIAVMGGFISSTTDGIPTTLGRGGSDYSATLIAACIPSDEVWIWTDVDGVMSADPNIYSAAHSIATLSYREVSELAYFGASVLHPKCIRPVIEAGIPLRVKNSFNPAHPGTLILSEARENGGIKAVTTIGDLSLITVEGKGMLGIPGIAARTFGAVAQTGTSVLLISQASSEQSICFAVPQETARPVCQAIKAEFDFELVNRDIDEVWVKDHVTIVTVVGADVRTTPGIAGKVFTATGNAGINVIAIAQGSTECSISLVVDAAEGHNAVTAIHSSSIPNPIDDHGRSLSSDHPHLQSQEVSR